jgi:hypothetical protein
MAASSSGWSLMIARSLGRPFVGLASDGGERPDPAREVARLDAALAQHRTARRERGSFSQNTTSGPSPEARNAGIAAPPSSAPSGSTPASGIPCSERLVRLAHVEQPHLVLAPQSQHLRGRQRRGVLGGTGAAEQLVVDELAHRRRVLGPLEPDLPVRAVSAS